MKPPLPPGLAEFAAGVLRQNLAAEGFAVEFVDSLLSAARRAGASDIHAQPVDAGESLSILWRLNGVLHPVVTIPRGKQNVIARLKVLADLLTYKTESPQEGRIRCGDDGVEMRLSTFPTIHGEKAVIRLFIADRVHHTIDQLGLPPEIVADLADALAATSGIVLVAGPAGSGKTTTLYACLRYLASRSPRRGLSSLEDPVEAVIPGVAQSQVKAASGFTYTTALKSLLRQDPEVIMVGEIRDRETADMVFQASLSGHLVLTSFHAGSSAEAISRLTDMGIEPFVLRSGLRTILTQRLLRRRCSCNGTQPECPTCQGTGHSGRIVIAELGRPDAEETRRPILERREAREIGAALEAAGMIPLRKRAAQAVSQKLTSVEEVQRILGASADTNPSGGV
ncbi:MAG TPA: GspE/PulE family protein [Caulifigura sp.]|nr:GspE/PulE family protein [Caulifigura sp.]